jgi:hypothetical protein
MQKLKLFLFVIVITPLICALFGILHDQITYTISPEYFTKFKFVQFGFLDDYGRPLQSDQRLIAGIIGVLATWWMGIPIGLFYGSILLFFPYEKKLYRLYARVITITFISTVLCGIAGYIQGWVYTQNHHVPGWYFPEGLVDLYAFIRVGSIHNMSYTGGTLGLMAGVSYLIILKAKQKKA